MAYGRGHASFTIDALKLPKDSLPATVTEPPPVFPDLINKPHPLVENPANDYDYKLKLKLNFNSSFRALHDPTRDDQKKSFIINKWKEEWLVLPRELRQACRINVSSSKCQPNLSKRTVKVAQRKKNTALNIDLNTFEEKEADNDDDGEEEEKNDENLDINENDDDENEGKSKGMEKRKLVDSEIELDGGLPNEEEDMDEDEAADYTNTYFDSGDRDDDDLDDDDDGGD